MRNGTQLRLQSQGDTWERGLEAYLRRKKQKLFNKLPKQNGKKGKIDACSFPELDDEKTTLKIGLDLVRELAHTLHVKVGAMNPEPGCDGIPGMLPSKDTSLLISVPRMLTQDTISLTKDEAEILGKKSVCFPENLRMKLPPAESSAAALDEEVRPDPIQEAGRRSGRASQPVQRLPASSSKVLGKVVIELVSCLMGHKFSREAHGRLLRIKTAIWTLGYTVCSCC